MDMYHNINTAQLASASNPINGITTNTTGNVLYRVPISPATRRSVCAERRLTAFPTTNSLQATVRKQFSRGFTFQGAYTWEQDYGGPIR